VCALHSAGAALSGGPLLRAGHVRNLSCIFGQPVVDFSRPRVPSEGVPLAHPLHAKSTFSFLQAPASISAGLWDPKSALVPEGLPWSLAPLRPRRLLVSDSLKARTQARWQKSRTFWTQKSEKPVDKVDSGENWDNSMGRLTPGGVCPVPKTVALSDGGNALTAYARRTRMSAR
jgi:hypothetical protein